MVLGGDFNVDFRRERVHTALLTGFCEDIGLLSITNHSSYKVDYTYNFNMSYFSIIDHFILSSALYNECMSDAVVFHDIDNLSDHEPIMSVAYLPLGHLGHGPPLCKISGPLRPWPPPWGLEIVTLNYLLQVEHLMYRLKYPFG